MRLILSSITDCKSFIRVLASAIHVFLISFFFAGAAYADCYDPFSEAPGTIGTSGVCKDMLIVNSGVLETAKNTGYAIEGPDGNSYTFTDSTYNVFTGQITDFSWDMYGASAGDINYWDVSNATNMSGMFQSDFNGNISSWNVSNVTNMAMMFRNNSSFNQDLSSWNVSKVTQMQEMFSGATAFDGNISSWDVSKVTQAHTMFKGAASFNQDLSSWDVGGVSDMHDMFNGATSFNGNISLWDVSNVTNMNNMFNQASAFNQDLTGWDVSYFSSQPSNFSAYATSWDASNQPGWPNEPTDNCYKMSFLGTIGTSGVCKDMLIVNSGVLETAKNTGYAIEGPDGNSYTFTDSTYNVFTGQITDFSWDMYGASAGDINYWDVSNATNMSGMFQSDFNGNISSWNVSNVTNMAMMFRNNSSFNQDLSSWNVSKVTQMQEMFSGATAFDGNISSWDVSKVTQAHTMFKGAASFNQDLSSWDVGGVSDMHDMFNGATSFNGNISLWDVSNVTNMNNMFNQASAFNQDLTGWDVSYFSSQPSNFSAYATSWDASNQPGWPNEPTDNCYKMSFLGTIGTSGVCKDMLIVNSGVLETAKNTGYAIEGPDGNSYTFTDSTYNVFTGQITDFSWDMYGASAGDINYWDVSNATNMSGMFQSDFNGNISSWNVSNVTNMAMMFRNNSSFNQDLSSWNVSKVTQMQEMFSGATAFDGNISSWDVSKVTQAHTMFKGAASFNQDLSSWDVGGVSDMHDMFNGATSFNGNISLWDVSNVTNMNNMFNQASAFNQDLTGWDVSYFSSQPSNFSAYATSWDASNQPGWGYPGFASSSPVDDSSNIALDADITLTFSENVQAGTGNITLYKSDATIVQTFNVSSDISISSATITLDPTADLISGTGYYIQVDATAVEDTSSNVFPGIADNSTFNFTAGLDSTLPTLVSSSPSDDATDIATSSSITLNFNETVQVATGKITLFNSDDTIFQAFDVTSDVSIFNSSVTVNPTAQLSQGGSYYIQVDATAIEDLSSNTFAGIADKTTLNFSVVTDTTAPTLSSVSIASNNSTTTQALENDIVNLTFTASEPISTPVVTFNSGGAAITDTSVTYTNTSGNTWTAAYTANASDTSGVVTFSIAFSDIAGNAGIAVISGSGVVTASLDTTAPIISSVGLNSDNNALTVNFNESVYDTTNGNGDLEVADFTLSISGGTATLNSAIPTSITKTSQTVWVLGFSTSGTANGSETITVVPASSTSIYDAAANAAATSQSNNMASLNDATIPTLSSVSIATNNAITSVANDGDVVTLTLTASEAISTPTVTFKSGGAAITDTSVTYTNTTGNTWTAAYTANASDTFGAVTFSIAYSDTAGNAAAAVTTTTNSSSVSFMPTPSAAFAGVKADVESKMAANARTQLNDFTTSTSSIVGSARSRFMNTSGVADSSDTALSGDVSSDSSDLKGSTKRVSSTADGKATSIIEVQYQYTETKEGLKSQNASGQIINEAKLSDSLTFGRFLGVTLGDGDAVGTNNIDIDFMGAQAGAYLVGNTKGGLVYDTYFAGSVIENKMGVTTSLMTADTKYYSSMLTTGASITGTLQVKKVEIRPTFSTDLSYMFRETADFDVKVGSATSVEQAAYGDIAKAQITFAPEFRLPFGEGSVITATPNVMCRYLKQGTDTEDCGQGISLGFKSTSKDGLLNLTAKAGMDRIGNETTSTLGLQFEMRF